MSDDPVRRAFDLLDRPVEPDPAFRSALLTRLLEESKARPRLVPSKAMPRRRPGLRRGLLVAAVLGLALAVLALVLGPLSGLRPDRQPAGSIGPSTPFRMTIEGSYPASATTDSAGDFQIRISWQGPERWRIEVVGGSGAQQPLINENVGSPGSYIVWDGTNLLAFDAATGTAVPEIAHAAWFSPLNLLGFSDPKSGWATACASGEQLADDVVAGRRVHHYRCPASGRFGDSVDLWVDVDSSLVLKLFSGPAGAGATFPPGPIIWYPGEQIVVTSIEYGPAFSAQDFAFPTASPVAYTQEPPPSTLTIGQVPPSFSGHTLDGTAFDLASLKGQPTVLYVWADWCPPCTGTIPDTLDRAFAQRTDLHIVTVGWSTDRATLESFVQQQGYRFPVVLPDRGDALTTSWGLNGIPALVALDADGRVVGVYEGWDAEIGTPGDVTAILDALVAGSPLPDERVFSAEQLG